MPSDNQIADLLRKILTDPKHPQILQAVKERTARVSESHKSYQLASYGCPEAISKAFTWSDPVKGYSVLIWKDTKETVELDVSGIITDVFLGPVRKETKLNFREEGSQRISIEAPGDPAFAKALHAVEAIYWSAEQHGQENAMAQGPPTGDAITAKSRFLTAAQYNVFGNPIKNLRYPEIDPDGRLQHLLRGGKFVYTEDNIIELFEAERSEADNIERKKKIHPSHIRRGQAAEVSVSFATVAASSSRNFIIKVNQIVVFDRTGSMILEKQKREYAATITQNHDEVRIPSRKRKHDVNDGEVTPTKRARDDMPITASSAGSRPEGGACDLSDMPMMGIEEGN
ncbi:hypothetical protein CVT26_001810 [Gymnopilus dilepis]|uniref:Uncharacterized protein n=1 Tax=Gymnopilus dilepis TaxID=231916 RepID=A0A409WAX4_9AGAR|nr:hypothetical protein CVT26_001810 [Gymnopilus dilepis]